MDNENKSTEVNEEYFDFTDNHGRAYKVPKVIKDGENEIPIQALIGHAISKTRKDTQTKVESKYVDVINEFNNVKTEYESTKSKLNEVELKTSDKNPEFIQLQKKIEQYEKEKQRQEELAKQNFDRFKNEKIKSEIFSGISGYDLFNQEQTAKLFMADVNIDFVEEDGNYNTKIKATLPNEKGEFVEIEGKAKDVFGKWIGLQSNSYLLKNNLNPGGGTSKTGATRTGNGQLTYKRSQLASNESVRKEYNEKRKMGLDVSIVEG